MRHPRLAAARERGLQEREASLRQEYDDKQLALRRSQEEALGKLKADAEAYLGEPVTQAKVQLIVYRSRYWYPLWRDEDEEDMPEEQGMYGQEQILDILGKPYSLIKYVKDRPGHDRRYAIDQTKIKRELGWQPTRSWSLWATTAQRCFAARERFMSWASGCR